MDDTLFLQQKLNAHAANKARAAIEQLGRALPCQVLAVNGALVQVAFQVESVWTLPHVWMPQASSQWIRNPVQIGDVGITVPCDTDISGITQGGGVANLAVNYGNLSSLIFVPVSSTAFAAPPRANMAWLNGPQGARIGDNTNAAYVDCNPTTGTVQIFAGGKVWQFSSAGLTMSTGIVAETHLHSGVSGGTSDTGPPVA